MSAAEAEYIWNSFLGATTNNKVARVCNIIGVHAVDKHKLLWYIKKQRLKLHTLKFKDNQGEFTLDENDPDDEEILRML